MENPQVNSQPAVLSKEECLQQLQKQRRITTADGFPDCNVTKCLGLVRGYALLGVDNIAPATLFGGMRSMADLHQQSDQFEQLSRFAMAMMMEMAAGQNANAIIAVRSSIQEIKAKYILAYIYGTAVVVQ